MNAPNRKKLRTLIILLAAGAGYYIWLRLTGLGIPCVFHLATGLLCPGCGITRMILCLSRGDFSGAFAANAFLLITLPFLAAELIGSAVLYIRGRRMPVWNNRLLLVYCGALLGWAVIRNILAFTAG